MARPVTFLIVLTLGLALCACSPGDQAVSEPAMQPSAEPAFLPSQAEPTAPSWGNDDPNNPQPDPSPLGDFVLWEDIEGGTVCPVELENARTIGGYTLVFDEGCLERIHVGYPGAWFPAEDDSIVIIDETRKVLVTLKKHGADEYYAERAGKVAGVQNLNLTRPQPSF